MTDDTASAPPNPAPGWYPDPGMVNTQRYWDGAAWSDHRAPGGAQVQLPVPIPTASAQPTAPAPGSKSSLVKPAYILTGVWALLTLVAGTGIIPLMGMRLAIIAMGIYLCVTGPRLVGIMCVAVAVFLPFVFGALVWPYTPF